jgi:hypothetical protein
LRCIIYSLLENISKVTNSISYISSNYKLYKYIVEQASSFKTSIKSKNLILSKNSYYFNYLLPTIIYIYLKVNSNNYLDSDFMFYILVLLFYKYISLEL